MSNLLQPGSVLAHERETHDDRPRCDDCDHLETEHVDDDYDFDMERGRYIPDPRPCRVDGCDCRNWCTGKTAD